MYARLLTESLRRGTRRKLLAVTAVAGYVGGRIDNLLMRLVDIMYAFPTMLLIILLMALPLAS